MKLEDWIYATAGWSVIAYALYSEHWIGWLMPAAVQFYAGAAAVAGLVLTSVLGAVLLTSAGRREKA